MRIRKDGEETRQRIIESACQVFGEKGYRDATNAEICQRARVNTAAINYHFGSKDSLYQAAWRHAAEQAAKLYPIEGGVPPNATPEERLRGLVRVLLQRKSDRERLGHFHRLRMMEIVNPTGLLDEAMAEWREKARRYTLGILRDLLGPQASQRDLELCEMSVVSQCLMAHDGRRQSIWAFTAEDVNPLVEHIMRFSCAGIRAIRREIRSGSD